MGLPSKYIIGADEVGYGCWAGSLYVAAVKAPKEWSLAGLNDSKKLSEKRRIDLDSKLKKLRDDNVISFAIAHFASWEIDQNGVADCLKLAYANVLGQLYCSESEIILDGTLKGSELKRVWEKYKGEFKIDLSSIRTEVKADGKFPSVMAASIIAKTARDSEMKTTQHNLYPNYGFNSHVGYGTKEHRQALEKHGLCDIHRKSYEPMKSIIAHRILDKILSEKNN